jgi:alcohol dehydrogenase class IV
LGARKILLVTDPTVMAQQWFPAVVAGIEESGVAYVVYADVSANPRDREVMRGAEMSKANGCEAIIAVGGGSPMDCAKGIGIVSSNGGHITDYEGVDNVSVPCPPLICVPTTAGSSADVSQFAIITDTTRKVKIAIVSKTTVPDAALIDPALTVSMDQELTANTGVDALTHAIEAYVSNAHGPVTDLFALEAVRRISHALPLAIRSGNDIEARSEMMLGSMYAGIAFSNAILGAVHAMAHSLGGLMDLPHGLCNAILLNHVIAYNFDAEPDRYTDIARAMGSAVSPEAPLTERKAAVLDAVIGLKNTVGATAGLGSLGVRREDLAHLAEFAINDPCMLTNPKTLTVEDIITVFANAL